MTPVSVSTEEKRESVLVPRRRPQPDRRPLPRRAPRRRGARRLSGRFPGHARRGLCDPGRGDRALGPTGDRLEGRPGAAAPDRALRHRPAGRPDLPPRARAGQWRERSKCRSSPRASPPARPSSCSGSAPRRRLGNAISRLAEAADLIGAVHAGIEVASSPLGRINELGPIAVISDFGNNNGLVIGPEIAGWRTSGFEDWEVVDDDRRRRGRPRPRRGLSRTARSAPRASCSS